MVCLNFKTYHKLILTDIQNYKLSHFSWCMAYFARGLDNIKKKIEKKKEQTISRDKIKQVTYPIAVAPQEATL